METLKTILAFLVVVLFIPTATGVFSAVADESFLNGFLYGLICEIAVFILAVSISYLKEN